MVTNEIKNTDEELTDRSTRTFFKDGVAFEDVSEKQLLMNKAQSEYIIAEHQSKINLINEMLGSIK